MWRTFFQGKKRREATYQVIILLVLFLAVLFLSRGVWRLWQKDSTAQVNLAASIKKLNQLQERQKMLEAKIAKLKTARGVEEEIRANYSLVKPGERVINIVKGDKPTSTATSTADKPWWQIF